jgi:NADH:ubiquinone oxidoreductase subunit K
MPHLDRWIVGGLVMVIGLFGLYLSSRANEAIMYYTGLALFIGAVLFNFFQIKRAYSHHHK